MVDDDPKARAVPSDPHPGALRRFARRMPVFVEGDPPKDLMVLERGRVKLVVSQPSGRETILDVVEPGTVVCSGAFLQGGAYCCTAVADADDTVVRAIPRERVCADLGDTSTMAFTLLHAATARATRMCRRVVEVTSGSVEQRVAALLLGLADERGHRHDEGVLIPDRLGRQDIADLCGVTVESAIRCMRRLEARGTVVTRDDGLLVRDRAALLRTGRGGGARRGRS